MTTRPTLLLAAALLWGCGEPTPSTTRNGSEAADMAADEERSPAAPTGAAGPADDAGPDEIAFAGIDEPRGIRINDPSVTPGYVLFTPMASAVTYLIDREGRVVHTWESDYAPGSEYLLDDGHLMRSARLPEVPRFGGGGQAGRIEKLTFDGELVWSYELATDANLLHHDYAVMPNGNVLAIAWEHRTPEQAQRAGRDPQKIPEEGLWPDAIFEIEPTLPDGGRIVWEWRVWDHLVQDRDPALPNYGRPQDHPGRIDVNLGDIPEPVTEAELAHLIATSQEHTNATLANRGADVHHSNALSYHAGLDQIAISLRSLSEIWIIDHAQSTEEARGPAGDLLYRWGNPAAYGHPSPDGEGLTHQHDIRWIPDGYPGAGNLTAFSNETRGVVPPRSTVVEFRPPLGPDGRYALEPGRPYGPEHAEWTFSDGFFSPFISGAHRMANGNTFVNFGPQGRMVEVDADGRIVWEYWSPYPGAVRMPNGALPQPGAPFMFAAFRSTFVPADHPALAGRSLTPLDPQPEPDPLIEAELAPFREPRPASP